MFFFHNIYVCSLFLSYQLANKFNKSFTRRIFLMTLTRSKLIQLIIQFIGTYYVREMVGCLRVALWCFCSVCRYFLVITYSYDCIATTKSFMATYFFERSFVCVCFFIVIIFVVAVGTVIFFPLQYCCCCWWCSLLNARF